MDTICTSLKLLSDKSKFEILCYVSPGQCHYGGTDCQGAELQTPTHGCGTAGFDKIQFIEFHKENNRLYYSLNREYLEEISGDDKAEAAV